MSDMQEGTKLWCIMSLKFGEIGQPIYVTDRQFEKVVNGHIIKTFDGALFEIGRSAYTEELAGYDRGLELQTLRSRNKGGGDSEHLTAWNELLENVIRLDPLLQAGWATENFDAREFCCKCERCSRLYVEHMDRSFIIRLQFARSLAGVPFAINSGWRCKTHNKAEGGTDDSSHIPGHAADVAAETSQKLYAIVGGAIKAGFSRIGIGEGFVHLDNHPGKAQNVIWTY